MQRLVVLSPERAAAFRGAEVTLGDLAAITEGLDPNEPCLVGIVPVLSALVTASDQTLDAAVASRFPPGHSVRTESLGPNLYQAFALDGELFERLRQIGKEVHLVPYGAAVRQAVQAQVEPPLTLRERTRILLGFRKGGEPDVGGPVADEQAERVVVDSIDDEHVITALRKREVLAVRHVRGGDPATEIQRTIAANRMGSPRVLCTDHQVTMELQVRGYTAEDLEVERLLAGLPALEQALELRFLTATELTRGRSQRHRLQAVAAAGVAAALLVAAAVAYLATAGSLSTEEHRRASLETERMSAAARLTELHQGRYGEVARRESVQLRDTVFDLGLSLPSQVDLVQVEMTAGGLAAVVERKAGAAPFSRGDLEAAIAVSGIFGTATVREEYEGHVIRYLLNVPARAAPPAGPAPLP